MVEQKPKSSNPFPPKKHIQRAAKAKKYQSKNVTVREAAASKCIASAKTIKDTD